MERSLDRSDRMIVRFIDEIFFYSGQYALFYIIMNLSASFSDFFSDFGHVALLLLVPVQAYLQARYGGNRWVRFFGSFILPVAYTVQEGLQGLQHVLDMAHVFFWVFSLILATLQTIMVSSSSTSVKTGLEFVSDPTHVYVIIGGLVLGLTLALGRVRVIELRDRIHKLFGRYVDRNVRDRIIRAGGAVNVVSARCRFGEKRIV